jgi:hypothetical protein
MQFHLSFPTPYICHYTTIKADWKYLAQTNRGELESRLQSSKIFITQIKVKPMYKAMVDRCKQNSAEGKEGHPTEDGVEGGK